MIASPKVMLASLLFYIPAATAQVTAPSPDLASDKIEATALPGGNSAAFRERMLDWSATDTESHSVVVEMPQVQGRKVRPDATRLPRLSSHFGYRGDPLHGARRMHSGIDIPGPLGTPIQASASGTVRFAGPAGGYGRMVEIVHGDGLATRYAHLSQILVRPGAMVARGDTIALMGSTGRSTGSHLHFEVRDNGRPANPLGYLSGSGEIAPYRSYTLWRKPSEPHISRYARARSGAEPLGRPPG